MKSLLPRRAAPIDPSRYAKGTYEVPYLSLPPYYLSTPKYLNLLPRYNTLTEAHRWRLRDVALTSTIRSKKPSKSSKQVGTLQHLKAEFTLPLLPLTSTNHINFDARQRLNYSDMILVVIDATPSRRSQYQASFWGPFGPNLSNR